MEDSQRNGKQKINSKMENIQRTVITVMLVMLWISLGLYSEIGGPTMIDLRIKFDADSEDIARSVSAQGIGTFVGALIAGIIVDALGAWKILLVTASTVLSTVSLFCMPFVGSLTWLWFMFLMLGVSGGLTNVAGQRILLEVWQEKAPSPMHAMHMGFGIGALVAPLIANPFLAVLKFTDDMNATEGANATLSSIASSSTSYVVVKESRVHMAYISIGLIAAAISAPFVIYPFVKCCQRREENYSDIDDEKQTSDTKGSYVRRVVNTLNPATYADGSFKFGLFMFVLIFLYFLNVVGGEQLFGNFVRTFSVDELRFSRDEASYLDTVFWGAFTIGRLSGSVMSHFVDIRTLFIVDMLLHLTAVTLANLFITKSKAASWALTAIVGFFISTLFPAGISFANTQIEVGGIVLTLVVFATGFGYMLYIWIEGVLYQTYGPLTILYTIQTSAILIGVIVVVLSIARCKRGDRFQLQAQRLISANGIDSIGQMSYTKLDQNSTQSEDE